MFAETTFREREDFKPSGVVKKPQGDSGLGRWFPNFLGIHAPLSGGPQARSQKT